MAVRSHTMVVLLGPLHCFSLSAAVKPESLAEADI